MYVFAGYAWDAVIYSAFIPVRLTPGGLAVTQCPPTDPLAGRRHPPNFPVFIYRLEGGTRVVPGHLWLIS